MPIISFPLLIVIICLLYFGIKRAWRNFAYTLIGWGTYTSIVMIVPTVIHWGEGGEWNTLAFGGFGQAIVCFIIGFVLLWKLPKKQPTKPR